MEEAREQVQIQANDHNPVRIRRRRPGDRKDGWRVRSAAPMEALIPYVMVTRNDSQNLISDCFESSAVDRFVHQKRNEGLDGFGITHVLLAAYVRLVSQRPRINRFISGQKIYARSDGIVVNMIVKRKMDINETGTAIKVTFQPGDTATDVYRRFSEVLHTTFDTQETDFDGTAKIINHIPGMMKKFSIWLLKTLDYFNMLPMGIVNVSPFHGSLFITSMASLGIPPIHHHLYNFGNVPVFMAFGSKRTTNHLTDAGLVVKRKFVDYTFVTDERICDGFYFASALKLFRRYLSNPSILDAPPEQICEDGR